VWRLRRVRRHPARGAPVRRRCGPAGVGRCPSGRDGGAEHQQAVDDRGESLGPSHMAANCSRAHQRQMPSPGCGRQPPRRVQVRPADRIPSVNATPTGARSASVATAGDCRVSGPSPSPSSPTGEPDDQEPHRSGQHGAMGQSHTRQRNPAWLPNPETSRCVISCGRSVRCLTAARGRPVMCRGWRASVVGRVGRPGRTRWRTPR
jgi:hypothetical protein